MIGNEQSDRLHLTHRAVHLCAAWSKGNSWSGSRGVVRVSAGAVVQAVKRNANRFPKDFLFQLTVEELTNLKSQIVISSWGGRRHLPYAFTEQGVAMLSSVLNSERAVKVNIAIMRAFVKLRRALENNRELARKFSQLEQRVGKHDEEIRAIIDAIRQLMAPPEKPKREIGFHVREQSPATERTRPAIHALLLPFNAP
jgi:ORF6N domain